MIEPGFVIRRRGPYGSNFWRRADSGASWVLDPAMATRFDTEEEAVAALRENTTLRGVEVVPFEHRRWLRNRLVYRPPLSAFIQEWPENKLTLAEIESVCAFLRDGGDPEEADDDLVRGRLKLEAARVRAKE